MRDDDEIDSDGEEQDKKELGHKYDKGEYVDLLSLLLLHKDTDSGTLLHYATRVNYFCFCFCLHIETFNELNSLRKIDTNT